jgi:hypothetical protein
MNLQPKYGKPHQEQLAECYETSARLGIWVEEAVVAMATKLQMRQELHLEKISLGVSLASRSGHNIRKKAKCAGC